MMNHIQEKQFDNIIESKILHKGFRLPKTSSHRKGLKCFGLLLLLSTMVGLSLNVSSDVSALKYQVDTIPFLIPESPQNNYISNGSVSVLYDPFRIRYDDPDDVFIPKDYWYFKTEPINDFCRFYLNQSFIRVNNTFVSTNNSTGEYQYTDLHYRLPYYDSRLISIHGASVSEEFFHCNSDGPIQNPDISTISMPAYVFGNPNGRAWLPYRYDVSGVFRSFQRKNDNGVVVGTKFDLSELFDYGSNVIGNPPDTIYYMDIPLGVRSPSSDLTGGSHVRVDFRIYLDADEVNGEPSIGSNNSEMLTVKVLPVAFDYTTVGSVNIPCSSELYTNPNELEAPYYFEYICEGDLPSFLPDHNPLLLGFTIKLHGSPYLWSYNGTRFVLFDSFTVTTNYDDTPASEPFGRDIDGGDVDSAPGFLSDGADTSQVDWFYSLTQMFSFTAINPFAPIFTMFSDPDNGCVHIPTIAGMLGATSDSVCPFFNSSIRSIVTPVFMLVGNMILFGFFVRWLGASSGNFFEDSATESLQYNTYYDYGRDRSFRGFRRLRGGASSNRRINK